MIGNFSIFADVFSVIGIALLIWNQVRARAFKATLNGEKLAVPTDEVREAFRRGALAAASAKKGGKRLDCDLVWKGNTLSITEKQ